jgi:hypothetical protein
VTATNGIGTEAQETFTLIVNEPPTITSAATTHFTASAADSFTVKAKGYPAPTFSVTGTLPTGVTFDGATGVLSGTPKTSLTESYSVKFIATNGIGVPTTQTFRILVGKKPVFESASTYTVLIGHQATFRLKASGLATETFGVKGKLPKGLNLTSTGVIIGTPQPDSQGTYNLTFYVDDGFGGKVYQAFTLIIGLTNVGGLGYWMVASDGGIFSYGNAKFHGSEGGKKLNKPIVDFAATPGGKGYWEIASDGGIFAFGNAKFHGSEGGHPIASPMVSFGATSTGKGYWEVTAKGVVYPFGKAATYGHPSSVTSTVTGFCPTSDDKGYYEVTKTGTVYHLGMQKHSVLQPRSHRQSSTLLSIP